MKGEYRVARKVSEKAAVAYLSEKPGDDWSGSVSWDGPGFYLVDYDDENDHTQANFGKKVEFRLNTPNEEGQPPDPENNEGHWVYAGAAGDDE